MNQKDFCSYVDVFYGNGAVDHFAEDGLASKWFYVKAQCGNTIPHAAYPFGKMSVGAYSGGYPTGYGMHYPNSCGGIRKMGDVLKIRGFSHLHQSGTGGIAYYYNYAITTPFYGIVDKMSDYHEVKNESGRPGYYSVEFNDIECELTVNKDTALHRYHFLRDGGRVAVDFSNDGLSKLFPEAFYSYVEDASIRLVSPGEVAFSGILSGVKLYFCVMLEGENVRNGLFVGEREVCGADAKIDSSDSTQPFGVVFDFDGSEVTVKVSYSTIDYQHARKNVWNVATSFDETAGNTYDVWNRHLSAIDICTDDEELKIKFYSNFYHSLIKPCDMTGEEVLGIKDDLVVDIATFWDQYKTLYPLIFMLYPKMSEKIAKTIINMSRTLGKIPCSLGISDTFSCEEQAKMLGILTLCDAYYSGIKAADPKSISECIKRELAREDFKVFLETGVFERYTHILDTTDACLAVSEITEDTELKDTLLALAENWVNAYDENGLMSEKSPYYEGDRYTYSFRLQKNMDARIALAGGKEQFVKMLDDFFGFHGESIRQITDIEAYEAIDKILNQYHRFEGFNNECDMETPYAYIYAGRQDRTCDIVHEAIEKTYTLGKGGLPGNNDSGGLSSCFLWNVLGIFPASGSGEFLLGCPHVERAVIALSNGNTLEIEGKKLSGTRHHVESVEFNGQMVTDFRIRTEELMNGGKLIVWQ
ncbi:MAG: glycoside hydrolase family 92 protein [Roseburia sp.]|nr:glycoside hydrolase family 92 protein [Roseburia sp.]